MTNIVYGFVMSFYSRVVRPILFWLDPETAHHWTVEACRFGGRVPGIPRAMHALWGHSSPELVCHVAGLRFDNPIGLAAGWDKSGRALRMVDHLGFGFAEIGSVSARPSVGNPKPRLFRLPDEDAIIVNYGLPNEGCEVVASRLAKCRSRVPVGVNIVKTNDGPNLSTSDTASIIDDYVRSVSTVQPHADYLTLNLSCPNASDGRDHFSQPGTIAELLSSLASVSIARPVFLKVTSDPDPRSIERLIAESIAFEFVSGFIFNLPPGKPDSLRWKTTPQDWRSMPGAVAGKPVGPLIDRCIAELYFQMPQDRFVIIGGGGVFSAEEAYAKIVAGASLVQIYSALVYEGPAVVQRINQGLTKLIKRDGFSNVQEAVGTTSRAASAKLKTHSKTRAASTLAEADSAKNGI